MFKKVKSMDRMPEILKEGLRELNELCKQSDEVESQLNVEFSKYGVNPDALKGVGTGEVQTEAFSNIVNGIGDIEKNIKEIERVFLHYAKEK